jgi:hypothetical protein
MSASRSAFLEDKIKIVNSLTPLPNIAITLKQTLKEAMNMKNQDEHQSLVDGVRKNE